MKETRSRRSVSDQLKNFDPKPLKVTSGRDLISTSFFEGMGRLPVIIEPTLPNVELTGWLESNYEFVRDTLYLHGGILFRGFGLSGKEDFERFISAVPIELMHYMESATPRTQLSDKVYTSTEFPSDQVIALHNELTYTTAWPMKIFFFCKTPPAVRGQTPIADVRKVLNRLDPKIVDRFAEKGWLLVRNFGNGFGPTWQQAFHMEDVSELEHYCRNNRIEFEWKGANLLRTYQARSAIAQHPVTRDLVWFNHVAFWHVSSLEPQIRKVFLKEFKDDDLPFNTYYGDKTPIEDSVIAHLREAYDKETVMFSWRQGDLLMLDNMLVAHGRNSFEGKREIIVAMGEALRQSAN
jgi:alpha-ketoglutarate-dependent taurine dioxygenase